MLRDLKATWQNAKVSYSVVLSSFDDANDLSCLVFDCRNDVSLLEILYIFDRLVTHQYFAVAREAATTAIGIVIDFSELLGGLDYLSLRLLGY